jgi:hypothetical protein
VREEGGDGEGPGSEASSLLSYTLGYVSLAELGNVFQVGFREPIHLCTYVREEGGNGEGADSEVPSLLSYTLGYVSLEDLDNVYQVGLREPMHLCTCVSKEGGDGEVVGEGGDDQKKAVCVYLQLD